MNIDSVLLEKLQRGFRNFSFKDIEAANDDYVLDVYGFRATDCDPGSETMYRITNEKMGWFQIFPQPLSKKTDGFVKCLKRLVSLMLISDAPQKLADNIAFAYQISLDTVKDLVKKLSADNTSTIQAAFNYWQASQQP